MSEQMHADISLPQHEAHSVMRKEELKHEIKSLKKEIKHAHKELEDDIKHQHKKGSKMSSPELNIFENGLGGVAGMGHGGFGTGLGAGLVGGVLGGALFGGRGGLFGRDGGGGAETRIEDTVLNTAILTGIGDIKAAIPLASAQTENVILNQTNALSSLNTQSQLANQMGFSTVKDSVQLSAAALATGIANVNQNILITAANTTSAIAADGEKTRALITSLNDVALNRLITTQAAEIVELRGDMRREADRAANAADINAVRTSIEINNSATASQAQGQLQAQQQAQFQAIGTALGQIAGVLGNVVQIAHATNNNVIAGNTGAVTTGAQTANPVNVKT